MIKFIKLMWKTGKLNEDDLEQLVNDNFLNMAEFDEIITLERVLVDE